MVRLWVVPGYYLDAPDLNRVVLGVVPHQFFVLSTRQIFISITWCVKLGHLLTHGDNNHRTIKIYLYKV